MGKMFVAVLSLAVLFAMLPANADEWNKKTILTFSEPVELPNVVLPAGTYVFKLLDSPSNRHIVQVFNEDETHIFATILAIPDYRLTPKEKTVVEFAERPVNTPPALRAWFYPGDNFGQEFVYPRARAVELAVTSKEPVLTADVKPAEQPEELLKEPVMAVTPEKREIEVAEVVTPPPPVQPPAPVPTPVPLKELPKTASPLPLIGLLGLASLGLAAGLRVINRRNS